MKSIVFATGAEHEVQEAADFYEAREAGLGQRFVAAIEAAVNNMGATPNAHPSHRIPGIQKAYVARFPYTIFFAPDGDVIRILAVAHQSRRPDYWADRLD